MCKTNEIVAAADCFRLLAACFYEPDKPLFQEQEICENLALLLQELSPEAAGDAKRMAEHLMHLDQNTLAVDYATLFIGPFELLAAPYGSIYLDRKRAVMGDSTIKVLRYYQEAGLNVEVNEPPDHIAIELEFMSFLYGKEAEAREQAQEDDIRKYHELRIDFFTTILQAWVFDFCEAVGKGTTNQFYSALADCLANFVEAQRQRIGGASLLHRS
jgi:TorA maturation chaperone TorD